MLQGLAGGACKIDRFQPTVQLEIEQRHLEKFGSTVQDVTGFLVTDADGHPFEMTQFYLNGDWSQTDVQLDLGPTKIYVIRTAASDGAPPAEVNGTNATWSETYRELDEAANSQEDIGTGTLNITCT